MSDLFFAQRAACAERDFWAGNVLPHPMQTGKSIELVSEDEGGRVGYTYIPQSNVRGGKDNFIAQAEYST